MIVDLIAIMFFNIIVTGIIVGISWITYDFLKNTPIIETLAMMLICIIGVAVAVTLPYVTTLLIN